MSVSDFSAYKSLLLLNLNTYFSNPIDDNIGKFHLKKYTQYAVKISFLILVNYQMNQLYEMKRYTYLWIKIYD